MTDLHVLDLDSERRTRAAAREGAGEPLPVRLGGEVVATLPPELPLAVLEPLQEISDDLTLLIRQAMQMARTDSTNAADAWQAAELVIDVFVSSPELPAKILGIIRRCAANLLTEEGLAALLAQRPSANDIAALAKGVFRYYGISLGEASASSDSSTDGGGTSNTTSSGSSGSTPAVSGPTQDQIAS